MGGERAGEFGSRLRRLREAAGLTQEALAERAGLTLRAVSALERGERRRPYPHTVRALADALGLSAAERRELVAALPRRPHPGAAARGDAPVAPPRPPTPLLGRERELAEVGQLLRSGGATLLTLLGPGGVGKTHLALQIAAEVRDAFPAGVAFVSLAPVGDPGLVLPTIARSLGAIDVGGRPLSATLRSYLGGKRLLLVLDNCEHIIDAVRAAAVALAPCPGLAVLLTSRVPLRVRGEREYAVGPLGLPDASRPPTPEDAARSAAVRLFVQRARAVAPAFALTEANAAAVAAICRRLDGVPLALELAAARARILSPAELLARFDHVLPILTAGARDLPERQRTMRAAIGWSYRLLEGPQQRLLGRLSAFRGGWDLAAAAAIGAREGASEGGMPGRLSALAEQSLVMVEARPRGTSRYRMLEPIREFAEERLAEAGEAADVGRRHAAHFLALAERAEPRLGGPDAGRWLGRLDAEHDNLRAALAGALARSDAETALRLAVALRPYWEVRGDLAEGGGWLEAALAVGGEVALPVRAKALSGAGWMAYGQGEYARATTRFEEGLRAARRLGDRERIAAALYQLGAALLEGDRARAIPLLEESVALGRDLADSRGIAWPLVALGLALLEPGTTGRPRRLAEEALAIGLAGEDALGVARARHALATVALVDGDDALARELLAASLTAFRGLGHTRALALCLELAASAAGARGDAPRAARLWGAADALREGAGSARDAQQRRICAPYLATARRHLGEEGWGRALAAGRALSPERAVAYALADAGAVGSSPDPQDRARPAPG